MTGLAIAKKYLGSLDMPISEVRKSAQMGPNDRLTPLVFAENIVGAG